VQAFLRAFFFFCPVIYDLRHIDARFHFLLQWNPLLYMLDGFRLPLFYGELPSAGSAALALALGLLALIVGYAFFRRFQDSFPIYV